MKKMISKELIEDLHASDSIKRERAIAELMTTSENTTVVALLVEATHSPKREVRISAFDALDQHFPELRKILRTGTADWERRVFRYKHLLQLWEGSQAQVKGTIAAGHEDSLRVELAHEEGQTLELRLMGCSFLSGARSWKNAKILIECKAEPEALVPWGSYVIWDSKNHFLAFCSNLEVFQT